MADLDPLDPTPTPGFLQGGFDVLTFEMDEPLDAKFPYDGYPTDESDAQREALKARFRESMDALRRTVTNGGDTCVDDPQRPYVLVIVNSGEGRLFRLVMMKRTLYVVAIEYRGKWFEIPENSSGVKGRKFSCDLCHLRMRYSSYNDLHDVSPKKLFQALNYFGMPPSTTPTEPGSKEGQVCFEAVCWLFAEACRFNPILDAIVDSFGLIKDDWHKFLGKTDLAIFLKKNWGSLSDGISARDVDRYGMVRNLAGAEEMVAVRAMPKHRDC